MYPGLRAGVRFARSTPMKSLRALHERLSRIPHWTRGRRLPFTVFTLLVVALAALASRTFAGPLEADVVGRFGFAPADLVALQWWRAVTSVFLTADPAALWSAAALLAVALGVAEALLGTRRVAVAFWGAHLGTLLVMLGAATALSAAGVGLGSLLYSVRDVGPSAGYVGCIAALLVALPAKWRRWAVSGLGLLLSAVLAVSLTRVPVAPMALSADFAHLTAFVVGTAGGLLYHARSGSDRRLLTSD